MIELTQLDGTPFSLNNDLIEVVVNIPETKILLTNGKYYLVKQSRSEVSHLVADYERLVYRHEVPLPKPEEQLPEDLPPAAAAGETSC